MKYLFLHVIIKNFRIRKILKSQDSAFRLILWDKMRHYYYKDTLLLQIMRQKTMRQNTIIKYKSKEKIYRHKVRTSLSICPRCMSFHLFQLAPCRPSGTRGRTGRRIFPASLHRTEQPVARRNATASSRFRSRSWNRRGSLRGPVLACRPLTYDYKSNSYCHATQGRHLRG